MNKIITFILALGFGVHVYYVEKIEKPKWESKVAELEADKEALSKALKQKAPKTLPEPEPFVEPEFKATEVVEKPVDKPAEVVKVDNSAQIAHLESIRARDEATYKTLRAEILKELERGSSALNGARNQPAPFNDSRIRTSEADKQIWYKQKEEKVASIQVAIDALKTRLSDLESAWKEAQKNHAQKLKELK